MGVTDMLSAMMCDVSSYACAQGQCEKCGWDWFKQRHICKELYKLEGEKVTVHELRKVKRNKYTVPEFQIVTYDVADFLRKLERDAVKYAAHHQAAEHALA